MKPMHGEENNYIKVETLLNEYLACQEPHTKSLLLGELLIMIRPLIAACCKHYYGLAEEDQIQDGYERAIKLINAYDPSLTNIKFLGYMKRMMMCYYWEIKRGELRNPSLEVSEGQLPEEGYEEQGYKKIELTDLLNILSPREKEIVSRVYLQGHKQKSVAQDLGVSLAYIKEALYKARKKMRKIVNM